MTSEERKDRFKVGDILVRVVGWDNLKIEPIGTVAVVLEADGDGLPFAAIKNNYKLVINDTEYELHEIMKSPLFQALL